MDSSFVYYIIALLAIVIAIFVIKKVASCLIRTVVFIMALAILAFLYYWITNGAG